MGLVVAVAISCFSSLLNDDLCGQLVRISFESIEPAAVSISQDRDPFTGWIICAGSCSGSCGPSSTAFSAQALSEPVTIKMMLAAALAAGAVSVTRSVYSLPTQLRVTTRCD